MRRITALILFACSLSLTLVAFGSDPLALTGAGAGGGCNPLTDVSGIKFWLKIESLNGTSNGATVSAWNDSSVNGINFSGAASLPTYSTTAGPSGGPATAFSGTSQFLKSSATQTQTQPYTMFGVVKMNATGTGQWFATGSSTAISIGGGSGTNYSMFNGTVLQNAASSANTSWHIWAAISNGASSKFYIDGGAAAASGNAGAAAFSAVLMEIGGQNGASTNWNGNMTDVLMYSGALTVSDINKVANCLAGLRGMTWTTAL